MNGRGVRVCVVSNFPLTPGRAYGGALRMLSVLLEHLSRREIRVTVLCPELDGTDEFELYPGVVVRGCLGGFEHPLVRGAPPFQAARAVETLHRAAAEHDFLYLHDGPLRQPLSGAAVPLVVSVRDLVYSASVEGALAFSRDRLIVASDYMAACARALFARFRPLPPDALRVVRNGFSVEELRPRDPRRMRAELRLPDSAIALLYPHRTDPAKGLVQVMRAVRWLKTLLPAATYARLRLLVPIASRWEAPPGRSAHGPRSTPWEQAIAMAEDLGVEDRLHYHPWVPVDRLAEYYSAGAATLCVGDFVEAFGNVHVESELCGTPAIVSRVGAQRTVLPDDLVRKVDYGDHEAAAEHLVEVIGRSDRSGPELVDHVTRHYGLAAMLAGYEEALLTCRRGPEIPPAPAGPLTDGTRLAVPPWCASLRSGYYNDYGGYCRDPQLLSCLSRIEGGCTVAELRSTFGTDAAAVRGWHDAGLVVARPD